MIYIYACTNASIIYNCTQYDCTVKYVYSLYMYIVHQHTCSSHDIKERSELYQTMKESHPTCRLLLAADSLKVMNKCNCIHLVMYI